MEETHTTILFEKMSCDLKNEMVLILSVYDTRVHLQISIQLHITCIYTICIYNFFTACIYNFTACIITSFAQKLGFNWSLSISKYKTLL